MSSSDEEESARVASASSSVKRRTRHIHSVGIHNLTATPHRDELLSVDATHSFDGGLGPDGSGAARRASDDLDLLGGGRSRRRISVSSVQSQRDVSSPPLSSPTSPLATTSFSQPMLASTSSPPSTRRPTLTRARASSRLSVHGPPSHLGPSPSTSTGGRPRSGSRASLDSGGGGSVRRMPLGEAEAIAEEDAMGRRAESDLDAGDVSIEEIAAQAASRLLESFITLRVSDRAANAFRLDPSSSRGRPVPGRSNSDQSSSSKATAGASSPTWNSGDVKGKGRGSPMQRAVSGGSLPNGKAPSAPASPRSFPRTPSASNATPPSTPKASAAQTSPSFHLASRPPIRQRTSSAASAASSSTSLKTPTPTPSPAPPPRPPLSSSPQPRPSSMYASLSPPIHIVPPASSSMSIPHLSPRPPTSRSFGPSLRPSSSPPSRSKLPPPANVESTPFYVSPLHAASTHPFFGGLDPASDFGKWDARMMREEEVVVEVWVRSPTRKTQSREGEDGTRPKEATAGDEWRLLKQWELDLSQLRKWNPKTPLPPNTLLISLSSNPSSLLYLPHPSSLLSPHRPALDRTLSDGEVDGPKARRRRRDKEWSGVGDAFERSLRETRMKKGVGFDDLHKLVKLQSELQDTTNFATELAAKLDRTIAEDEHSQLLRAISEHEERTRQVLEQKAALEAQVSTTEAQIAQVQDELAHRRANLETGRIHLGRRQSQLEELSASVDEERSELAALHPHLSIRRAVLARALEDIFPITPTMHHRTILFSILSIALPIPTQPKDPAPPLHLPASELPPGTHLDEESVATALGYVAMVVQVLAAQLGRVLPYPLTCSGSRSAVKDPISVMQGPTRVFPLFSKGVERYRFEYAVFLLNKDIEMLMVQRHIRIMDLRHTLPNLMNLLLTVSSYQPPPTYDVERRTPSSSTILSPKAASSASSSAQPADDLTTPQGSINGDASGVDDASSSDGGKTLKPLEGSPSSSGGARSIFWGLASLPLVGGGATEKVDVAKEPEGTIVPHSKGRRGTLIARAFGGKGKESAAVTNGTRE